MMPQQYCLRWKHHHTNVQSMFSQLLEKERFCDVTLYCSQSFTAHLTENGTVQADHLRGVSLRAHRVVLASCSELLATLLGAHETQGEPVLVIDGADPKHVRQLLDYMYTGEMNVHHSQLASLLKTAEELRIKGLSDIRWNNKDEPPDCQTGSITTTTEPEMNKECKVENKPERDYEDIREKINVNGGPPPLIKLCGKEKSSPIRKREALVDSDTQSPKRKRVASGTINSDEEDRDDEWRHGNLDITAERVVNWGPSEQELSAVSWDRTNDQSDEEWGDTPTDIGSFLHTNLKVDGDISGDDGSIEECPPTSVPVLSPTLQKELKKEALSNLGALIPKLLPKPLISTIPGIKSTNDPRFGDVIKLNEYLLHGRRPQFWEEDYVKRVMEAVRLKELEMKQAAEILGVSYGTLYGRYRDVYGCINRPYRNVRDLWLPKCDVLEKLERNEMSLKLAAQALGVPVAHLATYCSEVTNQNLQLLPDENSTPDEVVEIGYPPAEPSFGKMHTDFEPIPIEIDPSLRKKGSPLATKPQKKSPSDKPAKKILIGSMNDEESIPATVITTQDSGKWPSIRVASIDSLRGSTSSSSSSESTSPTLLMKTRPDLTIVAAKKSDSSSTADDEKNDSIPTLTITDNFDSIVNSDSLN